MDIDFCVQLTDILNSPASSINVTELAQVYTDYVHNILKLANITSINFMERALADMAAMYNMSLAQVTELPAIWKILQGYGADGMMDQATAIR